MSKAKRRTLPRRSPRKVIVKDLSAPASSRRYRGWAEEVTLKIAELTQRVSRLEAAEILPKAVKLSARLDALEAELRRREVKPQTPVKAKPYDQGGSPYDAGQSRPAPKGIRGVPFRFRG